MPDPSPHPRSALAFAAWPRDLRRGALLLGAGGGLYWSSFALGHRPVGVPLIGIVYLDLFLAWGGVLLHIAAWPPLWLGLRDLRTRRPWEASPVLAWRAFLLTFGLVLSAVVLLPLQYHTYASTEAWLLVLYVTAFPYLAWTFIPLLVLHGVLFGRVAGFLDPPSRRLTDLGVLVLFAVAAASAAVMLQHPGVGSFVAAWSAGRGVLPGAAFLGYALVALGLSSNLRPMPVRAGLRSPRARRRPWASSVTRGRGRDPP